MRISPLFVRPIDVMAAVVLSTCIVPQAVYAEQQVVLNSGTVLRGTATLEDGIVRVVVGDSTLEVPIADVKSIEAFDENGENTERRAERMLHAALELRAGEGQAKLDYRLLAEARRAAPDNISIAFWYAYALAEQGEWQGANEVFSSQSASFHKAYPGLATELEKRIAERVKSSGLPKSLQVRIETIEKQKPNSVSELQSLQSTLYYSLFRLVDQHDKPLAASEFEVEHNFGEDRLESFEDGYYLFVRDVRNGYSHPNVPSIRLTQPGFAPFDFQLTGTPFDVRNYGDLTVERLDAAKKKKVTIKVTSEDAPLAEARVAIRTQSRLGHSELSEHETDSNGQCTVELFPFEYYISAAKRGFTGGARSIRVKDFEKLSEPLSFSLYPQIHATISAVYGGEFDNWKPTWTSAETSTLQGRTAPGEFSFHVQQVRDQLFVGINSPNYQPRSSQMYRYSKAMSSEDFDKIKLKEISKLVQSSDFHRYQDARMGVLPRENLKEGDVLLGFTDVQDPQLRTEKRVYYKVRVDSLERLGSEEEQDEESDDDS
jgi:hypothetical protein